MAMRFKYVPMTPLEFRIALGKLDMRYATFARLFGFTIKRVAGWANGEEDIPRWIPGILRAMANVPGVLPELRQEAAERIERDNENPQLGKFPYLENNGAPDV